MSFAMTFLRALRSTLRLRAVSLLLPLLSVLTLGLAPYLPQPHIGKQLGNLVQGRLTAPIDIFDLLLHGAPWIWLLVAIGRWWAAASRSKDSAPPSK